MGRCSTYYGMFSRTGRGLEVRNKHGEIQGRTEAAGQCWSGPESTLLCLLPTLCIYCATSLCSCSAHVLYMCESYG